MGPLDIISLASAKNWLSIDPADTTWDLDVTRLIKTAINYVENYTCYRTYQRTEVAYTRQEVFYNPENYFPPIGSGDWTGTSGLRHFPTGVSIYLYPVTIVSVKDDNAVDAYYSTKRNPLKLLLYAAPNLTITMTTGYADDAIGDIPGALIDAAYKMIVSLFENRDIYSAGLPTDIQVLLNQYRRAII